MGSSIAGAIGVFFSTSPFRQNDRQHSVNVTVPLACPAADSAVLVSAAVSVVRAQFRARFKYAKAGAVRSDPRPVGQEQGELDLFSVLEEEAAAGGAQPRQAHDRDGRAQSLLRPRLSAPWQHRGGHQRSRHTRVGDEAGAAISALHHQVGGDAGGEGLVSVSEKQALSIGKRQDFDGARIEKADAMPCELRLLAIFERRPTDKARPESRDVHPRSQSVVPSIVWEGRARIFDLVQSSVHVGNRLHQIAG